VKDETRRLANNATVIEDVEGITEQKEQARKLRRFEGDVAELAEVRTPSTASQTEDDFSAEGLL
jgi:hypothetical protein